MSQRKKILVMTSTFPRRKTDYEPPFVYELSRRLTSDFEVHILAPHAPGLAVREELDSLHIHRYRYAPSKLEQLAYDGGITARLRQNRLRYLLVPGFLLAQYIAAVRLIHKENINLIHAHWLIPQGLIATLIKLTFRRSLPILCTSHGGDLFSLQGKVPTELKKLVIRRSDHLTVVSQAMKEKILELGANPSSLEIAPMGVDVTSLFTPDPARQKPNTLVFAGRLVEKKGLTYLIEALPEVLKRHPDTHLTIVGSGPEKTSLHNQAESLGITDKIDFLGPVRNTELPRIYQSNQIAVFPFVVSSSGDQEGLGLVMIEALGCGCSVVASDLPAIRDIITDQHTGRIVPPGNPKAIADTIIDLLEQPSQRKVLATTGREFALSRFNWEVTSKRYGNIIKKLI